MNAGYAFKIAGTLAPPEVTDFAIAGVMSGFVKADFSLDMYVEGDVILPPIKIFDLGIPGLSIPGIAKLGPSVEIQLYTSITVDVALNAEIPMTWDFQRLDFVFPSELAEQNNGQAEESKSTANFAVNLSPGDLAASIAAHLMPKVRTAPPRQHRPLMR